MSMHSPGHLMEKPLHSHTLQIQDLIGILLNHDERFLEFLFDPIVLTGFSTDEICEQGKCIIQKSLIASRI